MSISECNSCNSCGGKCDACSLDCCQNNMNNHKEIYKLINDFENKIYYALQNLYDKCGEIKKNLCSKHGVNIELSNINDKIIQSEDFLNKMKIIKKELQNYNYKIKNEMEITKKEKSDKINKLNEIHLQNKNEIKKKFETEENKYKIYESKFEEVIKSKKKVLNDLSKEKDSININIDEIVNDFINEERKKAENEFDIRKNEIESKYIYEEKEFVYSQEELERKNQYLNEIKKIKSYSDKIPNFENWVNAFNLKKYFD